MLDHHGKQVLVLLGGTEASCLASTSNPRVFLFVRSSKTLKRLRIIMDSIPFVPGFTGIPHLIEALLAALCQFWSFAREVRKWWPSRSHP